MEDASVSLRKRSLHETDDSARTKRRGPMEPTSDKENLEASNAAATAAGAKQAAAARPASMSLTAPQVGIIKCIHVENFMCHHNLKLNLGRNVNFIHGQNGSGKSAILAAIQICLGANARRTHRARNLKDLIRKDAVQAKIRVTVHNHGTDGYRPDEYGDSITVERTISLNSSGYNGYKLLDHTGKEKSRSKRDLDDMLDTLNIQVENPVAVLDQEDAKKFLMGKAEDKYSFFMKATELERCDNTYSHAVDTVQELCTAKEKVERTLQSAKDQVESLKGRCEEYKKLEKFEDQLAEYNVKYAWAYYSRCHAEYVKATEALQQFEQRTAKKANEVAEAEIAAEEDPGSFARAQKERHEELVSEAQSQATLKLELENQYKAALAPAKHNERQLHTIQRQKREADQRLSAAKKRLQEARNQIMTLSQNAESDETRRLALLTETEDQLAKAKSNVDQLKLAVAAALRAYEDREQLVQEAASRVENARSKLRQVSNTVENLKLSTGNALAILGPRVAEVYKMVEEAKRRNQFTGTVVGPIGFFIKIAPGKDEYASIAEVAIGRGHLDRFIVTNDHDRRVLQDIRQRAKCFTDCGILQIKDGPRFRIPEPPDASIETVASVLTIENDLVFNCLVDNAGIDQAALSMDKQTSERSLLVKNSGGGFSIKGIIKKVYFLPNGDNWTVRNGSLAVFSNDGSLRRTIGVDRTAAISEGEKEAAQLNGDLQQHNSELNRLRAEITQHQKEWNLAKNAFRHNDARISDLTSKIDELRLEGETSANVTIDTTEYEDDVAQVEQELGRLKESEAELTQQIQAQRPELDEIRSRLEACAARNEKVLADMKAAEAGWTQHLESQSQKREQLEKARGRLEKYRAAVEQARTKSDALADDVQTALAKARKLAFRLEARKRLKDGGDISPPQDEPGRAEDLEAIEPVLLDKDPKHYEAKIMATKKKLEQEKQKRKMSHEDYSVILEKYMRAKSDLAGKVEQLEGFQGKIDELVNDIQIRKKRWRQFRSSLSRSIPLKFDEMLRLNKYSGDVRFDHDNKTLDLMVNKEGASGGNADVRSLSGGEKSYSTMCLILALGEQLETPFRILDEFDVFMDPQVRKLTINNLVHVAKQLDHRQFIFITPQDLSGVNPDPKLKIWKLNPPARLDVAGGPTQQLLSFATQSQAEQ